MNEQQRYLVPLTLEEIEALLNSHCHSIPSRQYFSSALSILDDVYLNCCEPEVVKRQDKIEQPMYHLVSNRLRSNLPNLNVALFAGKGSDIFEIFRLYQSILFDANAHFFNRSTGVACLLPLPDTSTEVNS